VRHEFETRSFPESLAACPRGFAFYLADPIASVHEFAQKEDTNLINFHEAFCAQKRALECGGLTPLFCCGQPPAEARIFTNP
jgi:hypothetical protein